MLTKMSAAAVLLLTAVGCCSRYPELPENAMLLMHTKRLSSANFSFPSITAPGTIYWIDAASGKVIAALYIDPRAKEPFQAEFGGSLKLGHPYSMYFVPDESAISQRREPENEEKQGLKQPTAESSE